ncbi:hypothetical protein TSUD_323300 [Trifolium subterraneum]|uniref:Uncharacterized protein n=1 Tax=Trifolium subterraneum TaxID=3900 RepID=A0A2Z6N7H2_TRISU|nr:hypothetical protein TSUD_323300 [Trifolium subterraneum]
MIKRRFFKIDHGDKDGSDPSSSSSDEDYDNQVAEVSHDSDNDGEVSSVSSGYKSEDSSANEIEANSTEANSAGLLSSEDDAGTINEREMLINKELPSESDSEKPNVIAETKPLSADIPTTYVLKFKSVFKCRLCPRIICLTEDTLRNHLQSKRHARSEKLHREGRLKAILNSDGEIEDLEVSENETEDSEDNTKKNNKGPKLHKKKFKKNKKEVAEIQTEDTEDNMKKNEKGSKLHKRLRNKKNDNGNSRKMRSAKGSSKRSRRK